jgi:hypothetical protein
MRDLHLLKKDFKICDGFYHVHSSFLIFSHTAISVSDLLAAWYRVFLFNLIQLILAYSWKFIIIFTTTRPRSRDCSVGIATGYRLDARDKIPRLGQYFPLLYSVQTGSGAHPASCPMGTGALSPGTKRPGREADHTSI